MTISKLARAAPMLALSWIATAAFAATPLPISPVPLPLAAGLPPNLFLTIDDSGSMAWGHVPDGLIYTTSAGGNNGALRGYKSVALNPLYYDPTQTYVAPTIYTGSAATAVVLTTSFTAAYVDGFNPANGAIDLSSHYLVTAAFTPGKTAADYAAAAVFPNRGSPAVAYAAQSTTDFATSTTPSGAYYYNYNAANTGCSASTLDDKCYTLVFVSASSGVAPHVDERQNFANWFSFYRTRHLAIATSAALAMASPSLATARIAWQAINSCLDFTGSNCQDGWGPYGTIPTTEPAINNSIQRFAGQHKSDFYSWLQFLPAAGGTPMRAAVDRVGQYLIQPATPNGPWGLDPQVSASTTYLSCRSNFHMVLTDGEWNNDNGQQFCGGGAGCGNADSTATTLPDGKVFTPGVANSTAVYGDTNVSSLADIGFHYWSTDLQPTMTNNVPTYTTDRSLALYTDSYWNPRNDPANWQHLVNYTVGLGLNAFMTAPPAWGNPGNTFGGPGSGYSTLVNGTVTWPVINVPGTADPNKVYDLWHLAIDSRGEAFAANSPADIQAAFTSFLGRAQAQSFGASAAAASSTTLNNGTDIFQASYDPTDWSGLLTALPLVRNPLNGTYAIGAPPPGWTTETFPAAAARNIVTLAPATNATVPPAATLARSYTFSATDLAAGLPSAPAATAIWPLPGTQTAAAPAATNATNVVNWLRGDQTNEQTLLNPTGTLRARTRLLGDVAGSDPVFSYDENFGYGTLPIALGGGPAYFNYLSTTKTAAGRPRMVYLGANDGMLHGFDADLTNVNGYAPGSEVLAYVPSGVLGNVAALSSVNYVHNFYVDATPFVGDAYFGGAWHTVLVGLTGAGAKSAFALDVTNPQHFGPAPAASHPLWEIDATAIDGVTALDNDLGNTIGQAIIAPLHDGNWYAIFGNGYNSARGCAVLYLVQLDTGAVRKIDTSGLGAVENYTYSTAGANAYGPCPISNGLGSPTLYDSNGDRIVDYVYAGDQLGNLWKFDLTSASAASWMVSSTAAPPAPLFRALAPSVVNGVAGLVPQPITAAPELGPTVSGVGVEIYFGTGRFFTTADPGDATIQSFYAIIDSGAAIATPIVRSMLQQQTISAIASAGVAEAGRSVSQNAVAPTASGWYMDLPDTGERVLGTPLVMDGEAFFSTLVPNTAACTAGGTSYLMAVGSMTGAGGGSNAFFNSTLPGADGILSPVGFVRSLNSISDPANNNDVVLAGGATGTVAFGKGTGRIPRRTSWQEIVQ